MVGMSSCSLSVHFVFSSKLGVSILVHLLKKKLRPRRMGTGCSGDTDCSLPYTVEWPALQKLVLLAWGVQSSEESPQNRPTAPGHEGRADFQQWTPRGPKR